MWLGKQLPFYLQAEAEMGWQRWTSKTWVLGTNDSSGQASR